MREYNYSFAELIGTAGVNQIKECLLPKNNKVSIDLQKITKDLDTIIAEKDLKLSAQLIRLVIGLAQTDLHIWHCKDQMSEHPDKYDYYLKLAHQINGIRNQIKNMISAYAGDSKEHTNDSIDGLEWKISI